MISTLIALPYELARLPLAVVDSRVADRLPETSRPRVVLDRTIGTADKLAGSLLRNHDITLRGTERLERSETLLEAARLEQQAAAQRAQARETTDSGRRKASDERRQAQERAESGLDEADAVEARAKQEATTRAAERAATKKAAADERAAARTATAEQRKEAVVSTAETRRKATQRKAQSELDDARETKKGAAEARADAERLSDLAEAKKQKRQRD